MTRDEVAAVIRDAVTSTLNFVSTWDGTDYIEVFDCDPQQATEAVLAALAAAGLVIGTKVQQGERLPASITNGSVTFPDSLALVRVVG